MGTKDDLIVRRQAMKAWLSAFEARAIVVKAELKDVEVAIEKFGVEPRATDHPVVAAIAKAIPSEKYIRPLLDSIISGNGVHPTFGVAESIQERRTRTLAVRDVRMMVRLNRKAEV